VADLEILRGVSALKSENKKKKKKKKKKGLHQLFKSFSSSSKFTL